MLLFVGVGGHVSQDYTDPLNVVLTLWTGRSVPGWIGGPFARNLFGLQFPRLVSSLSAGARGLQFAPLVLAQAGAASWLWFRSRSERDGGSCQHPHEAARPGY
jgi:hypothetical protein